MCYGTILKRESVWNTLCSFIRKSSYEIKDETINGDNALVTVQIEVLDYRKTISELNTSENTNFDVLEYNNQKLSFDTTSPAFKDTYFQYFAQKRKAMECFCRQFGCHYVNIRTDKPLHKQLKIL